MKKTLLILSLLIVASVQTGSDYQPGSNSFYKTARMCVLILGIVGRAFQSNGDEVKYSAVCHGEGGYDSETGTLVCLGDRSRLSIPHYGIECTGGSNTVRINGITECTSYATIGPKGYKASCSGNSTIDKQIMKCDGVLNAPYNRTSK